MDPHLSSCKMSADSLACAVCLSVILELGRLSSGELKGDHTARWFHLEEVLTDNRSLHSLSPLPLHLSAAANGFSPAASQRSPAGSESACFLFFFGGKDGMQISRRISDGIKHYINVNSQRRSCVCFQHILERIAE